MVFRFNEAQQDLQSPASDWTSESALPLSNWATETPEERKVGAVQSVVQARSTFENVGSFAATLLPYVVDTTAASFGLTEKGEVSDAIFGGAPGLRDWMHDNQGALGIGASALEIVGSAMIATRVLKAGTAMHTILRSVPGAKRLAGLDRRWLQSMANVRRADLAAAEQGIFGESALVANIELGGKIVNRGKLASKAKRLGAARFGAEGAITEAVLYATSNANEMLYFDDAGANLAMASLGIVLPAGIGRAITGHHAARFARNDRLIRKANGALDVGGFDSILTDPHGAFKITETGGEFVPTGKFGQIQGAFKQGQAEMTWGWKTDQLTALSLGAAGKTSEAGRLEARGEKVFGSLVTTRETASAQQRVQVKAGLDEIGARGIPGVEGSQINSSIDVSIGNHQSHLTIADPSFMYGIEHIGKITDNGAIADFKAYQALQDKKVAQLEDIIRSTRDIKEAEDATKSLRTIQQHHKKLVPFVVRNGELVPLEDAVQFPATFTGKIVSEGSPKEGGTIWTANPVEKVNNGLGVTDNGTFLTGKRANGSKITIGNASLEEMQQWYAAADDALTAMIARPEVAISLPKNPTWAELDFAEELFLRSDGSAFIKYPGTMNRESARIESLAQKFEVWKSNGVNATYDLALRERLNLPRLRTIERGLTGNDLTPIDKFFSSVDSADVIRKGSSHEIENVLRDYGRVSDLATYTKEEVRFTGNSFSLGRAQAENTTAQAIESFLVLKRPADAGYHTKDFLENRIANQAADGYQALSTGDGIVGTGTRQMLGLNVFPEALNTSKLHDGQLQSRLGGNRTVHNAVQFLDVSARESPTLLAAIQLQDNMQRFMRGAFEEIINPQNPLASKSMVNILNKDGTIGKMSISDVWAAHRVDEASVQLMDQFISARRGWELKPKTVSVEGWTRFPLAMTPNNKKLYAEVFGKQMVDGDVLTHVPTPGGRAVPVELNRTANNTLKSFDTIAEALRVEENQILRSQGFSELNSSPHYIPPTNDANKFISWVVGPTGKAVLKLRANTEAEMSRIVAQLGQDADSILNRGGYKIRTEGSRKVFATLFDRKRAGIDDPNIPVLQSDVTRKGGALSPFIDHGGFEEAIQTLQGRFSQLGNDILTTTLRPQLMMNQTRSSVSQLQKVSKFTGETQRTRNIYDLYESALLGKDSLTSQGSQVGGVYNALETFFDLKLQQADAWFSNVNPWSGTKAARASYERLTAQMADQMPFDNVDQFVAQQFATKSPLTSRKLAGELNSFTAGLVLRVFETGHAILNLTGMINTAPAVIKQFTIREGESVAAFNKRVGPYAHTYNLADGSTVANVDIGKIMHRAYKNAWDRKKSPDWEFMKRNGYLNQEVAEFHKQMASMTKRNDSIKFIENIKRWSTMLADKSEEFSRSYGHMIGLELADVAGIVGKSNRHQYAHEVANKMIANYSPTNRPEIFQGAAGSVIGLFQSYMWNYWNRVYRYMETGDMRSLATQMSTQATLFGGATVPGFKQFNDLIGDAQDGERNPIDAIYESFGNDAGDVITSGVLSTMPKLFGADDGVALYSRADVNPRLPVISGLPPSMAVAAKFWEGMSQGIDLFRDGNPGISQQQITEILGNMIVNRPIAGFLDIWAGANVDTRGQVISNEVNSAMSMATRLLGLRPLSEAKATEALMVNKRAQELQVAARSRLNNATRAAIRGGNFDMIPDIMEEYINTGGKPEYIPSYMRGSIEAALLTRNERQMISLFKNGDKMERFNRLLRARTGE